MAKTYYRDAYILVNVPYKDTNIYMKDKVAFYGTNAYLEKDDECTLVGAICDNMDIAVNLELNLDLLRADGFGLANAEDYIFVSSQKRDFFEIESGVVVAIIKDIAIIYCGVVEITETDTFENEQYVLTEKGLKYLADTAMEAVDELLTEMLDEFECTSEEREENSTMDNLFGNLGFGKLRGDRFKLSMNGIAVAQDSGKYVVYNKDNNEFVDATQMLFDIKDALFLLPAVEVAAGDTVLHEGKPYFIVDTTNEIKAVSYEDCTQTVLIPKSTMFGIKYFTKVFSMFGDNFAAAGDLFSNPMMLMALMEGKNSDLTQLMLLTSLSNGDLGSNPMALAMMLKGDKSDDSLSTIALMSMFNNGTNPFAPKKTAPATRPASENK